MKLLQNFIKLYQGIGIDERSCSMEDISLILGCTSRNCRILLRKMEATQWLIWQAGRGRGHRSFIRFLVTPTQLKLDNLSSLLQKGELGLAFAELDTQEQHALVTRLPAFMTEIPDNSFVLRIPIFRKLESLDPIKVFLRLECHLVKQIFSRLTEFDYENQRLIGGLAHYWESNSDGTIWNFWCRPNITFHDGSDLTLEEICKSIIRLRDTQGVSKPIYANLESVEITGNRKLSFQLKAPDFLFPHRLSTANSSIVPSKRELNFDKIPVGSGPFKINRHNSQQLTLGIFREYYSKCALLNEIDLWLIPENKNIEFNLQFGKKNISSSLLERSTKTPFGCTYLIVNSHKKPFNTHDARLSISNYFSGSNLVDACEVDRIPARGLLPGWMHIDPHSNSSKSLISILGMHLTLVHGPRAECALLAEKIKMKLREEGIVIKTICVTDAQCFTREWASWADMYLGSEVIGEDADFGCFEWLSWDSNFRHWMPDEKIQKLNEKITSIQKEPIREKRMRLCEITCKWLVTEGCIMPISHERTSIYASTQLSGLGTISEGFVPFNELWLP